MNVRQLEERLRDADPESSVFIQVEDGIWHGLLGVKVSGEDRDVLLVPHNPAKP